MCFKYHYFQELGSWCIKGLGHMKLYSESTMVCKLKQIYHSFSILCLHMRYIDFYIECSNKRRLLFLNISTKYSLNIKRNIEKIDSFHNVYFLADFDDVISSMS